MWRIEDDNGSITVEMCVVMPIVVSIVMMLIFIIIKGLNEGVALGRSQMMTYQYSETDNEKLSLSDNLDLNSYIFFDVVSGRLDVDKDSVSVYVNSNDDENLYSIGGIGCKREWGLCTKRLRRWQLYGDVLCE